MLEELREFYDFNRWANGRILGAVAGLSPEQLNRALGSSFASVFETLRHILHAEWIWLERWEGRSPTSVDEAPRAVDWETLTSSWSAFADRQRGYLDGLTESDLSMTIEFRTLSGVGYAMPLWQLLRHVVNHSTYHRGQVTTLLRQLGAEAAGTDLLLYYRERSAAAAART